MSQLVEITINRVQVGVRHDPDADVFVGFCPRFEVYSQGETKEQALEAVTGAIVLRIGTAFDHGRLDKILRQAGFDRSTTTGAKVASPDDEFVAVTFREGIEVTEVGIRVPLGALLHQRNKECQH